jgi:hypothetical protein
MTHDRYAQPSLSAPLDDGRRQLLADLEAVATPTPVARGTLRALSLAALSDGERRRVDVLAAKWATS